MNDHDKLADEVRAILPKGAPKPEFVTKMDPSQPLPVLRVTFGKAKVACGFHGSETDADLAQYARNIVAAYEAQK